jgi:hypothetical protein
MRVIRDEAVTREHDPPTLAGWFATRALGAAVSLSLNGLLLIPTGGGRWRPRL